MSAASSELTALRSTAANLTASIAARLATPDQSADFQAVTTGEQRRLAEVNAEIARLSEPPPSAAPSSSTSSASSSSTPAP